MCDIERLYQGLDRLVMDRRVRLQLFDSLLERVDDGSVIYFYHRPVLHCLRLAECLVILNVYAALSVTYVEKSILYTEKYSPRFIFAAFALVVGGQI